MVRSHLSLFSKFQGTKFSNFRNSCDQKFHVECERFPHEDFALGSTELVVEQLGLNVTSMCFTQCYPIDNGSTKCCQSQNYIKLIKICLLQHCNISLNTSSHNCLHWSTTSTFRLLLPWPAHWCPVGEVIKMVQNSPFSYAQKGTAWGHLCKTCSFISVPCF